MKSGITLGPQTAAALGTVNGTLGKRVSIKVVTSGAETVSCTGALKDAVSAQVMFKSIATGALHSSVAMDDGSYYLDFCPVESLIFLGSGAADTKTVTVVVYDQIT